MRTPRYALDSWAALRYLEGGGQPALRVRRVLRSERPYVSWINLGEILYVLIRSAGLDRAEETVAQLRRHVTLDQATPERVIAAARLKAGAATAYADAFAIATASARGVTLLTGDPEILASGGCRVEDLR